ncbi:hypothetical protein QTP70_008994 [Hemibagrus guttatus]|uniref:Chromo domain-containing protein n=1 Tax=Hemibagrus guttatus TaxID=175788 RepID=A0AAE0Q178_9TELE|nr:hypothetical protein QTP70_008994 [Hemibagrus guttatus]
MEAVVPGRLPQVPTPQVPGGPTGLVVNLELEAKTSLSQAESVFYQFLPDRPPVNPVTYHLQLLPSYHILPTFHVSLLKPARPHQDDAPPRNELPLPLDTDRAPAYRVNSILKSQRNRQQYLVAREGYGLEECSWVDADDILDPSLVEEFYGLHPPL